MTIKSMGRQCIIVFIVFLLASPAWAGTASDQLKETLGKMITVLNDPDFKSPDKRAERNKILHRILRERFDEVVLARSAMGDHWQDLTEEEKNEFTSIFSTILEETYFGKIDDKLQETGHITIDDIHFIKEMVKGSNAQIASAIRPGDGSEIPVIYRLKNRDGNWLVVDMAIEGIVITRNYRSQFNEILSRESFSQLIERLKAKQAQ